MAWTNVGFDGTINEAQWSALAGLLGNGYVAAGNGDCLVTAVPGARSVSVAAGSLYGDGVLSTNSGPETVAMTTPVNGQWYVIALRRTWATNTAALVAIAGATTTTTTPTAPPTSFPTLNTNVGVLTDQPIAWAWCNSANTTVVVYDIRLKAVKSLPPVVANQGERDAKFMTPTQGLQVWRDDLGAVETYYGLYNASTNPGGRDTAGYYVNDRQTGLIPISPTSVAIASGSGSVNSIGKITFGGATVININGIFTSKYNYYKIVWRAYSSQGTQLWFTMRSSGVNATTSYYSAGQMVRIGGTVTLTQNNETLGRIALMDSGYTAITHAGEIEIVDPAITEKTTWRATSIGGDSTGGLGYSAIAGTHGVPSAYDGITIYPAGGVIAGSIQIFGYNDK